MDPKGSLRDKGRFAMVSESKVLLFHLTNIHSYRLPKGSDVAEALQLMKYGIEIKAKQGPL